MSFKVRAPGPTNYKAQREFCKKYGIRYDPSKYITALRNLDIPDGGLVDSARITVLRAFMRG